MQVSAAPNCFLCDIPGSVLQVGLRDRIFGGPGEWNHRTCADCGLVWLDPQPHPESIGELYDQYYPDVQTGETPQDGLRAQVQPLILRKYGYAVSSERPPLLARLIARSGMVADMIAGDLLYLRAEPGGEVLDVGCSSGFLLANLQRLGWKVTGVELDAEVAAAASQQLGRPVLAGSIDDVQLEDDRYDAILLSHVIEHLPNPLASLAKCARALKPGGTLIMATPNTGSFGRRAFGGEWLHWDPPRHLFIFNEKSLAMLTRRAGLRPVAQRTLARQARWTWHASRMIRRSARPTDNRVQVARSQAIAALLFQLGEHAVARWAGVGEELLMMATKA